MNTELKDLISLVKNSNKPVRKVVETYFETIGWSILKSEWERMSTEQRDAFINKLERDTHG